MCSISLDDIILVSNICQQRQQTSEHQIRWCFEDNFLISQKNTVELQWLEH